MTDCGSVGCGSTVWKAWPPKPAFHCGRCGWSHSACSSANVSPPSVGPEDRAGLGAGVHDAGLGARHQLPDPLDRRVGALGEPDRAVRGLLPGGAEVVGATHLRAEPARRGAGQQPWPLAAGVDQAGVDLLHVEVRAR